MVMGKMGSVSGTPAMFTAPSGILPGYLKAP
jgi:hypothetical protein